MADATAFAEFAIFSPDGDGERPAGVPIEVESIKSSRFIGSLLFVIIVGGWEFEFASCWSDAFLNCAMPLGALEGALVACLSFLHRRLC